VEDKKPLKDRKMKNFNSQLLEGMEKMDFKLGAEEVGKIICNYKCEYSEQFVSRDSPDPNKSALLLKTLKTIISNYEIEVNPDHLIN